MGNNIKNDGENTLSIPFFNRVTVKFMLTVGLVVAGLLVSIFLYIFEKTQDRIISEVHKQAEIAFEQVVITRRWNAEYGGVYVEKIEGVVSNPYLEKIGIASDITSLDNRTYTLKNPALMTKELSDIAKKNKVLEFHITSLNHVNPSNSPDEFEKKSLLSFAKGETAANQIVTRKDSTSYQYIAPLYVEKGCLKCHKNYNLGDVRGGISVFLPMQEAYTAIQTTKRNMFVAGIGLIFGMEILLFFLINRLIVRPVDDLRTGAMKIGAGDLEYRIPVRSNDEIDILGTVFNTMASDIASNFLRVTESEEKFCAIFTGSPEGIALIDSESGAIFDCNPAFERQTGRELNHLKKMKIWEIWPPEKADAAMVKFNEIVKKGIGFSRELELQTPDGKIVPVEFISNLVTIQGKQYILSMTRDLTERRQAEAGMQESERKYRELVESANSIILRWSRDGKITFMNKFGLNFFGYTQKEILGRHVVGTIVPETESTGRDLRPLMDKICANPKDFEQNINENMHRNGKRVWISWTNKTVLDRQGQVINVLSIGSDLTERRQLEEELKKHREHLEALVRDRTKDLEDAQKALVNLLEDVNEAKNELKKANEKLMELDRLKSMFIASMSHELRTPLNSIIGFTGIMLQGLAGDINEEQKDQLGRVKRAGQHLLALITDVIDVSKIEAGKVAVHIEVCNLAGVIGEAAAAIKPDAESKGLALKMSVPQDVSLVTDRRRLLQCVLNLLSNAVKYTEKGAISVSAYIDDDRMDIRVIDTGIGIAEADLPLLFTSFARLESHLKIKTPGTGLGLYLTRKIATELLGGEVFVESLFGKGSVFGLRIPMDLTRDEKTKAA